MKRKKLLAIVLSLLMAMMLLAGCGETDESSAVKADFDGTWVNDEGDVLLLDSENRSYTLRRFGGRAGNGDYDNHSSGMMFHFDGFLYGLMLDGDTLQVEKNGWGPNSETLEGPFVRDDSIEIVTYTLSDLDGFWSNGDDEMFQIDSESGLYAYKNAAQATSEGSIDDDGDGRGPYIFLGDGEGGHAHFIVTTSDYSTFSLQPFEGMIKGKGTFTRIDAEEFEWAFGIRINRGGEDTVEDTEATTEDELTEEELTEEEAMALMRDFIQEYSLPNGWIQKSDVGVTDESVYRFELNPDGTWRAYWIAPDGVIDDVFYSEGVVAYVSKDEANTYTGEGGLVLAETGQFAGQMALPEYDSEQGLMHITFTYGEEREFVPYE